MNYYDVEVVEECGNSSLKLRKYLYCSITEPARPVPHREKLILWSSLSTACKWHRINEDQFKARPFSTSLSELTDGYDSKKKRGGS
jgi:hypothetical protein